MPRLDKLGLKGQDTSELFFRDCRVRAANLLGREGQGFRMLMEQPQQERLCIAVATAASRNTQFELVELTTEVEIGQSFVDKLLAAHVGADASVCVERGERLPARQRGAGARSAARTG